MPAVTRSTGDRGLDAAWLTVVAAVRPALARLEAHQLSAAAALRTWTNRPNDLWQIDPADLRRLIALYSARPLDFATLTPDTAIAVALVDRFSEVIPADELVTGAAFGFDAPASRAPQAILLAVPPVVTRAIDHDTLAQTLVETRELAHARMARPVDLDPQFWGLAPTGLFPATGTIAMKLEELG
jgi:hypothetical protein